MYALPVAESSIYTTNLYHDTPPICIAILLQKYQGQGSLEHSQWLSQIRLFAATCEFYIARIQSLRRHRVNGVSRGGASSSFEPDSGKSG